MTKGVLVEVELEAPRVDVEGGEDDAAVRAEEIGVVAELEPDGKVFPVKPVFLVLLRSTPMPWATFSPDLVARGSGNTRRTPGSSPVDGDGHGDEGVKDADGRRLVLGHVEELLVEKTRLGGVPQDLFQPVVVELPLRDLLEQADHLLELEHASSRRSPSAPIVS